MTLIIAVVINIVFNAITAVILCRYIKQQNAEYRKEMEDARLTWPRSDRDTDEPQTNNEEEDKKND